MHILRATSRPENFYRSFTIPKKAGGRRNISEPLPSLKEIQRWMLVNILYKCQASKYSKAYVPKNSIKSNSKFHRGKKIVLTIDIENYFQSIKREVVFNFFQGLRYTPFVADIFSRLCCLDDSLPQGASTSPMLSNLITKNLDEAIAAFVMPLEIKYSRYADDLTFSGDFNPGYIIKKVKKLLDPYSLKTNNKKIRVQNRHERQLVTGIVVNEKMQVAKNRRKKVRQEIYYIEKFGFENHCEKISIDKFNYLEHLLGTVNHMLFVNPKDAELKRYRSFLYLLRRAREETLPTD